MKMTPNEKYYYELSEVYIAHYERNESRLKKIMIAKGVTTEMFSDLLLFEKNSGKTEKSKKQLNRLILIEEALDVFDAVASTNVQIKHILSIKYAEINLLKKENEELKSKLEGIESAWNQM